MGHCIPDNHALRSALNNLIPGVAVEFAADQAAMEKGLGNARLLLVNRALDGDFDAEDGVELIRILKLRNAAGPRLMVISNFPEAQAAAVAAGALPGFGKRDLYSDRTRQLVQAGLQ